MNRLICVLPCYNEEEVLPETSKRLKEKMNQLISSGKIAKNSRVMFVNDGSADRTWEIIKKLHDEDSLFQGVCLSRNRGHQNALLAGLMVARQIGDVVISMDVDLQDDIDAIDEMLEKYFQGADIVYGVRAERTTDTFFKRFTAQSFYKFMSLLGANIEYNHADYRLMSKRALDGLAEFDEVNLFLRGLVPMVGYKTDRVFYDRAERFAGESKYPLKKMLHFAMEGITSLSVKPIRMISGLGILIFFVSLFVLVYCIIGELNGRTIPGWTTTVISVWGIGGIIMICLGVIGEYIGKIYLETKRRPRYIVEEYLKDED
ncbi:glycosyltransferase family 2 protein [Butyrivibrio sp. WCE2006]|uniref:glycosyltransferase family 2 protein n=1 Tax=Butyrivibrio sp. WCE2006 TaxID=1410611 RepID=UPI0005D26783|nr:glycosyltransferase family 2 protein [Butyrivibrio sp. WCE2006]